MVGWLSALRVSSWGMAEPPRLCDLYAEVREREARNAHRDSVYPKYEIPKGNDEPSDKHLSEPKLRTWPCHISRLHNSGLKIN